jgi:hypothetical protein
MPLLLYRFDTIPSSASSSGTFLSFATSFPYLQISDKGMKALTKMNSIRYYHIVKRCRERLPKWMPEISTVIQEKHL